MLNQATMDMLTSMKMTAMAAEFANQLKDPTFNELGFKERLGLLVSAEWKGAVAYGLELMLAVFSIVQGMVSTIITQSGSSGMSSVSLPQELSDAINNVGFWDSIPLWAVTLIGGLLITVLSFTMILTVYGRMFSLWMYAAIAPIPLSTFAGEATSSVGKNFIRSYAGVCLQGVVIALSCIIFSAISSSPPAVDTGVLTRVFICFIFRFHSKYCESQTTTNIATNIAT